MTKCYQTSNEQLCDIRNLICKIEEKSVTGDYIYRGEPEHHEEPPYYGKICSSLFRQYARIEADEFNIEEVQKEILAEAEVYSHETDDHIEILTQLQHFGGKTNLIDFTTDYLIALFFTCDNSNSLSKDGRLILLRKTDERKSRFCHLVIHEIVLLLRKACFFGIPVVFLVPMT